MLFIYWIKSKKTWDQVLGTCVHHNKYSMEGIISAGLIKAKYKSQMKIKVGIQPDAGEEFHHSWIWLYPKNK